MRSSRLATIPYLNYCDIDTRDKRIHALKWSFDNLVVNLKYCNYQNQVGYTLYYYTDTEIDKEIILTDEQREIVKNIMLWAMMEPEDDE